MQRIFATTLYSRIIVKCNVLNQNFIIETNEIFIEFMEFMSLKMRPTKLYLHFCHNIINQIRSKHLYTLNSYKVYLFLILMFLPKNFNFGGTNFIVAFQVCKCSDE